MGKRYPQRQYALEREREREREKLCEVHDTHPYVIMNNITVFRMTWGKDTMGWQVSGKMLREQRTGASATYQ